MAKRIDTILSEALLEKGLISSKEIDSLLPQVESSTESLQQLLIKRGIIAEKDILNVLAERLRISFVSLKSIDIDRVILEKVPLKIAMHYRFVPLEIKRRIITIAVASPFDIKTQDEIRTQLGYGVELTLATQQDITEALKRYYGLGAETLDKISITTPQEEASPMEASRAAVEDIEKLAGDASVIKLVNQIILEGWKKRATDIHIEPQRGVVSLRYRIDGLLYDTPVPLEIKNFLSAIISRIKIMSNLNIVERRLPQDGRAIVKVQEQILDLRISTIPTPFGESVVIRILPTQMLFSLEKLGLLKRDLQVFERLIQKPHGIIFVTGPTGSGKTTTLYTCLSRINTRERKIITIEDPIEYEMSNITQIQVMPEIDFDFARGLRSILRHDPDVIMVGEVRDLETAQIAIRVALTGHLVFSTLHTNDAASGISRLLDIGVEPYLLSSSVEAFIAQRLIRTICPDCKTEDENVPAELKVQIARDLGLKSSGEVKVFRGKGCQSCNQTGFFGRTAIYEILPVDDKIKDLIVKKIPSNQIKKMAVSKGMRTLRQDGWQKVIASITTPEEVMKNTSAEDEEAGFERKSQVPVTFKESEPRAYNRLDKKVNISFKTFKSPDILLKRGFTPEQLSVTKNISAGGLLFVSSEPLTVGSILEMKMELPDSNEFIECLIKVLRIQEIEEGRNYDVAGHFLDITSAHRTRFNKYIESERK
ncbi:MAG: Flp pilus assembly complex ATPase component TadA [Candidatus Omnitrophica bacterium]|nr:Flp pilus assembly complex ATPase component TadA [Candidatus Omnitrophota bacterium]